ncbi:MAG TPA: hypothetical protein VGS07_30340 [Thermoanaerobaculia bacterium]|jgi:hypothetical protein|nr:hypothetical protein [Thermoanaerobaculia bacterium]
MNGPGRKSLKRRVHELEIQVPRTGGGPIIVFERDIPPGEKPKPWYDFDGRPRSPIVIRLDTRPAPDPDDDELDDMALETAESSSEQPWWGDALESEETDR